MSIPLLIAKSLQTGRGSTEVSAKEYRNNKPRAGTKTPNKGTSGLTIFRNSLKVK